MGGDNSKTEDLTLSNIPEEDYFLLEHPSKISLKHSKTVSYYIIDPLHQTDLPTLQKIRSYFKLDSFPSIKTLKQELSFYNQGQIIKVICCQPSKEDLEYL